jgi:hypothetical protein
MDLLRLLRRPRRADLSIACAHASGTLPGEFAGSADFEAVAYMVILPEEGAGGA